MTSLRVALLVSAATGMSLAEVATAEAARAIAVPADEAVMEVSLPASAPVAQTLERYRDLGLTAEHLIGLIDDRCVFRRILPATLFEETAALLADAEYRGNARFIVTQRASAGAIERARQGALPALYAEARSRAELILRESGYQPGPLLSIVEQRFDNQFGGTLDLRLSVSIARLGRSGVAPSAMFTTTPLDPVPTGRFDAHLGVRVTAALPREAVVDLLRKEELAPLELAAVNNYASGGGSESDGSARSFLFNLAGLSAERLFAVAQTVQRLRSTTIPGLTDIQLDAVPDYRFPVKTPGSATREAEPLARLAGLRVGALRSATPAEESYYSLGRVITGVISRSPFPQFVAPLNLAGLQVEFALID